MRIASDSRNSFAKYERAGMKRSSNLSAAESSWPKPVAQTVTSTATVNQASPSPVAAPAVVNAVHQCPEPECGRRFNRKYTLVEHMKTHTGEKPHVCPVRTCNKRFSTSGNLSRHKRLHGFIQPIECPAEGCRCTFPSDNKLEKHMKFHLGGAVQVCGIGSCGKTFSTTGNLNRHMKNHHPEAIRRQRTNEDESEEDGDGEESSSNEEDEGSGSDDGTFGSQLKAHSAVPVPTVQAVTQSSSGAPVDQLDVLASILHEEIDFVEPNSTTATASAFVVSEEEKSDESDVESPSRKRRRTILDDMISFHVAHFGE
ncbi:Zinc finger protein [Globisporangium polare]